MAIDAVGLLVFLLSTLQIVGDAGVDDFAPVLDPCGSACAVATSEAFAGVVSTLCVRPDCASTPMCAFIPKDHWLPFFVRCISGSRPPLRFFVDDGAAMRLAPRSSPSSTGARARPDAR